MYDNHLSPVFGQPAATHSDNGSHFIREKVTAYFRQRGGTHFTGPISHPSSTGLMERVVQGMIAFLRATTLEHGTAGGWSNLVKDGAFWANTKFKEYMAMSPMNLCLDFIPKKCTMIFEKSSMILTSMIPRTLKKLQNTPDISS